MTNRLTDDEIRAIRERADKAPPLPWRCEPLLMQRAAVYAADGSWIASPIDIANAEFISYARADIPRLLADRAELVAEIEKLRDWAVHLRCALDGIHHDSNCGIVGPCLRCERDALKARIAEVERRKERK